MRMKRNATSNRYINNQIEIVFCCWMMTAFGSFFFFSLFIPPFGPVESALFWFFDCSAAMATPASMLMSINADIIVVVASDGMWFQLQYDYYSDTINTNYCVVCSIHFEFNWTHIIIVFCMISWKWTVCGLSCGKHIQLITDDARSTDIAYCYLAVVITTIARDIYNNCSTRNVKWPTERNQPKMLSNFKEWKAWNFPKIIWSVCVCALAPMHITHHLSRVIKMMIQLIYNMPILK